MACSDELVIPEEEVQRKEQRVKGKVFAREIDGEKTREVLIVVVEALGTKKNKGSGSREALVETGKEEEIDKNQTERTVEALAEALFPPVKETGKRVEDVDENQTEGCTAAAAAAARNHKIYGQLEWVTNEFFEDTSSDVDEVDEEVRKEVNELQEYCKKMWLDCVDTAIRAGLQFADPSHPHPHCLVACDPPREELIALSN